MQVPPAAVFSKIGKGPKRSTLSGLTQIGARLNLSGNDGAPVGQSQSPFVSGPGLVSVARLAASDPSATRDPSGS